MQSASNPSHLFNIPTASVLRSLEFAFSGGSAFGIESGDALQKKLTVGFGGIAEIEFSSSGISNQLTGKTDQLSTTSFKVNVIPERIRIHWYIPDVAFQLRSSDWESLEGRQGHLRSVYSDTYVANENLVAIENLQNRFSVLYLITGKQWSFFGCHIGISQSDVRTKEGVRMFYHEDTKDIGYAMIPEIQKNIISPFGGFNMKANASTALMAEIQPIPQLEYDFENKSLNIRRTWLFVAGVRFNVSQWLSVDTGVRYQENYVGIADAQIDIGFNVVVPIRDALKKKNVDLD